MGGIIGFNNFKPVDIIVNSQVDLTDVQIYHRLPIAAGLTADIVNVVVVINSGGGVPTAFKHTFKKISTSQGHKYVKDEQY